MEMQNMVSTDYQTRYGNAQTAYIEGDLDEATKIADSMAEDYPDDPSIFLLQGHIYLRQQQYEEAKEKYHAVLEITDHQELISLANQGLEQISNEEEENINFDDIENYDFDEDEDDLVELDEEEDDWTNSIQFENVDWDVAELEDEDLEDPTLQQSTPFNQKFTGKTQPRSSKVNPDTGIKFEDVFEEPKKQKVTNEERASTGFSWEEKSDSEQYSSNNMDIDLDEEIDYENFENDLLNDFEDNFDPNEMQETGVPTFVVSSDSDQAQSELNDLEEMLTNSGEDILSNFDDDYEDYSSELEPLTAGFTSENTSVNVNQQKFEPSANDDDDDFFFAPDELDDIPDIGPDELPVSSIFTKNNNNDVSGNFDLDSSFNNLEMEEEAFAEPSSVSELSPAPTPVFIKPQVEIPQGKFTKFFDASLQTKQFMSAGATGIVTFIAVFIVSFFNANITTKPNQTAKITYPLGNRALLSLVAGLVGGATTLGLGQLFTNHLKRYQSDLQTQFEYISQGNFKVKATVYSQDEFGQLAATFNQMTKVINTTTTEAKKRAEETERAREDLQRQVIRLLDDVEGAARGDLTVQAEVTADVLGAVADAFNLTITSLREIVTQVKKAAVQVNKGSTDSELFARNQSSDALRMAEELAVTLNSVQMMTDSIQRVAENAREAEEVARSSSVTALKGGDAVERTVAGILQIRETVSETTRKVKRLAEASQQISTIVAVIGGISSRTNLLALNASIQAARAGEAGRGFAIVADEVRQLADRSAKSLQEIEQIVLQIQTETGSVMTAMEEGIQQVIDVTERSEQAKRSLEDIIQVSNRIDALVRSITADTVEQRENSRAVAKVMQAVELTAQATSQESQRVAGSLQNLVSIGRDLLSSVERFKVSGKD